MPKNQKKLAHGNERSWKQIREKFRERYYFCEQLLLLFITLPAINCGPYSFSGAASTHIKTIAVPVFEDRTAEFGVKERLSNAIIEEFTRDNTLKIADRRVADSVLLGTLLAIQETAGAYNEQESVQEVRVTLMVQLKYEDVKKRKTVWEAQMAQFGSYSPQSTSSSRQAAIDEAIEKVANEVRNKTVSDW